MQIQHTIDRKLNRIIHFLVRSERLGLGARGDQKRLPPTGPVLRLLRAALCRTPLFFPVVTE